MGTISITVPANGSPRGGEETDTANAFSTINTLLNGNIDGANAPTLSSTYHTFYNTALYLFTSSAAGTYLGRGNFDGSSGIDQTHPPVFSIIANDMSVAGLTTKLRMRGTITTNATAPARTFTLGLYPIATVGGSAGFASHTLGTVVSGSTIAFATPAANSVLNGSTSDFNLPTNGVYGLGVNVDGAPAGMVAISIFLQMRHV